MKELFIIGAGGHGAVVAEIAHALGYSIAGFVDDNKNICGASVFGWEVLGDTTSIPDGSLVALGIGTNAIREHLIIQAGKKNWILPILVHPSAVISPSASIGEGTVVMAQAVVNARAKIGKACTLNTSCSIDHDCVIGNAVHICPGVHLAGGVSVGARAMVGVGSCVRQCIEIGADCVIGAGSVVISNIPDGITAFGNPAKPCE